MRNLNRVPNLGPEIPFPDNNSSNLSVVVNNSQPTENTSENIEMKSPAAERNEAIKNILSKYLVNANQLGDSLIYNIFLAYQETRKAIDFENKNPKSGSNINLLIDMRRPKNVFSDKDKLIWQRFVKENQAALNAISDTYQSKVANKSE